MVYLQGLAGPASAAKSTHDEATDWAGRPAPRTKGEAQVAGREYARAHQVEHIIRNLDGRIGERNTYGHDPHNIPG